jgi:hypothetical protein
MLSHGQHKQTAELKTAVIRNEVLLLTRCRFERHQQLMLLTSRSQTLLRMSADDMLTIFLPQT